MKSSVRSIRIVIAVIMLVFGLLLLFNVVQLPEISFAIGLGTALVGLLLLAVPESAVKRGGLIALLLGTYITLREADIVQLDYIRIGLGCIFVVAGLVGVFYDLKGGESELALKEHET